MKTLISFFAIVMVFFAGCAKDYTINEEINSVELKKANVPIPFKADLCAVPDMNGEFYLYPIPGIDPRDPNSYCVSRMLIGGASPFDKQDFRQSGTIDQAVGLPRVLVFEDNL